MHTYPSLSIYCWTYIPPSSISHTGHAPIQQRSGPLSAFDQMLWATSVADPLWSFTFRGTGHFVGALLQAAFDGSCSFANLELLKQYGVWMDVWSKSIWSSLFFIEMEHLIKLIRYSFWIFGASWWSLFCFEPKQVQHKIVWHICTVESYCTLFFFNQNLVLSTSKFLQISTSFCSSYVVNFNKTVPIPPPILFDSFWALIPSSPHLHRGPGPPNQATFGPPIRFEWKKRLVEIFVVSSCRVVYITWPRTSRDVARYLSLEQDRRDAFVFWHQVVESLFFWGVFQGMRMGDMVGAWVVLCFCFCVLKFCRRLNGCFQK